jgi:hypothetical protein
MILGMEQNGVARDAGSMKALSMLLMIFNK